MLEEALLLHDAARHLCQSQVALACGDLEPSEGFLLGELEAGKPHAVRGALAARLGTTRRSDGKLEVTYNGHPLYRYVGDTKPGDTKGQGLNQFGGGWDVLSPNGKKIEGGS